MPENLKNLVHPIGGVLPDPPGVKEKNWKFDAIGGNRPDINPKGDWRPYKPTSHLQATKYFDPFSCVSESLGNAVNELLEMMMESDPSLRVILEYFGMIDENGRVRVSGRWLAKKSGTVPGVGNSQYAVFETLRKHGIVSEKMWPSDANMTQQEYYSNTSAESDAKALEFLEYIGFNYEDEPEDNVDLKVMLRKGPMVVLVGGTWFGSETEAGMALYRNDGIPMYNHQVNLVNQENNVPDFNQSIPVINDIFDTYDPFDKRYAGTYPFAGAKVIYLTKKKTMLTAIYRQTGQKNCYLYVVSLDTYFPIKDSAILLGTNGQTGVVAGGDIVKPFSGNKYPTIPEKDIPLEKIKGAVWVTDKD